MNRRLALLPVIAALLSSVATAAPALAADHTSELSALGTSMRYRTVIWTSQGADMSIMAPQTWSFVLTPEGQARFNAAERPDVLTMGYRGDGALRPELTSKVAALKGTPGLRVLLAHGNGHGDSAAESSATSGRRPGGETRFVAYRYKGDDAFMVAGRLADREGLKAVLDIATSTGECS